MTTYPPEWHRLYGNQTGVSAQLIVPSILEIFSPSSVLEVGCGNAHWAAACIENGIGDFIVADGPWNNRDDLLVPKDAFRLINLQEETNFGRRFDLAICLEVAEHVAAESAMNIVETLINSADVILFSAAIPLQGGFGHVNERWPSYWRDLFREAGYEPFDLIRQKFWNNEEIHYWYRQNSFIYVNKNSLLSFERASQAAVQLRQNSEMFDAVHPEKFLEVASYDSLVLRRLAAKFPAWFIKRAIERVKNIFS